jgi:hypothetical protein
LLDVRELVRQEPLAFRSSRPVLVSPEHDVASDRVRARIDGSGRDSSLLADMNADVSNVATEPR